MTRYKSVAGRPSTPSRAESASSIRGRISAPIPIPTDDEEFPMRGIGTGIATPLGPEGPEKQLRLISPIKEDQTKSTDSSTSMGLVEPPIDTPAVPSSNGVASEPIKLRAETASLQTESVLDAAPQASIERPERSKSASIKRVLGRLFGKKRKNESTPASNRSRAALHRSDPSALRSPQEPVLAQKRSASLPINEYNRALRSHTPNQDALIKEDYDGGADEQVVEKKVRPRRAITSSWIYGSTRTDYIDRGLTPRPASGHARTSKSFPSDENQAIGTALTSGNHKRRSRSLNYIREPPSSRDGGRPRSDEIRYWRKSYDADSALSPALSQKELDPMNGTPQDKGTEESVMQNTPQPFNFGPLGEMAGMKITQAASLESRVSNLESQLQKLESLVMDQALIQPETSSSAVGPSRPAPDESSLQTPGSHKDRSTPSGPSIPSRHSSRPSAPAQGYSPYRPNSELSPPPSFTTTRSYTPMDADAPPIPPPHKDRPLSTSTTTSTTIRAVNGNTLPDIPYSQYGSLTAHHYSALLNLITAEQTARQHLEDQLLKLQHQLHTVLTRGMLNMSAYSSSSPEQQGRRGFDDSMGTRADECEFSTFDHNADSIFGSEGGESRSGYDASDVFQTPKEERGPYIHDEYVAEGLPVVGAPFRTMSLSQMTLGKGGA